MSRKQAILFSPHLLAFAVFFYLCLRFETLSGLSSHCLNSFKSSATCGLSIDKLVIGDCEYGVRTNNQSKFILAVFLSWTNPPTNSLIEVKVNGQTKLFDPFEKACPPYVQFILDPDGSNQMVEAYFTGSGCLANPVQLNFPGPCDPPVCSGVQTLGGKVFQDFNNNGTQESSEIGIPNIEVRIYDDSKNLLSSTSSKTNGYWAIQNLPIGRKVRVEYQVSQDLYDSNPGPDNKTRTQKTQVGDCRADLGIFSRQNLIEENPWIATAMFSKGDATQPTHSSFNNPTIVANLFNTTNGGPRLGPNGNHFLASAGETGSIWGLAFQKETKSLFSAAFLKRNASLGPHGLGAIYLTDLSSFLPIPNPVPGFRYYGNTSLFLNLDSFGILTGPESMLIRNLPVNPLDGSHDSLVFDLVGKWGLGDMDLNTSGDTLFVVNMYNRSLVRIAIGNPISLPITADRIQEISIPDPGCNQSSDWRPWGLKFAHGKLYLGGVCSAESTGVDSDMKAVVLTFANDQFDELLRFDLHYQKGFLEGNLCGSFRPWSNHFYNFYKGGDVVCGPVPVLSDIEFDSEGNLILALGDRFGYQSGGRDFGTRRTDPIAYIAFSGGDNLKLFKLKDEFLLEKNATAGFYTTRGANNGQGICGGEYYYEDGFFSHQESAQGALALHPSYNTILSTMMDPANIWSNGWSQIDNSLGTKRLNYNLFTGERGTFGKSSGLGDIEILNGSSTQEGIGVSIGNYIWLDRDADGLQDPGEDPIIGLPVLLLDSTGTLVSESVTDISGLYLFKSLFPSSQYYLQLGRDSSYNNGKLFLNSIPYSTSILHNRMNFGNKENDSDANKIDSILTPSQEKIILPYFTGKDGENDFSLDFGLVSCANLKLDTLIIPLCAGDSIQIGNEWFSKEKSDGNIVFPGKGLFDCDSSLFVKIEILEPSNSRIDTTVCEGGFLMIHGKRFDKDNLQDSILLIASNQYGCDSTLVIHLTTQPVSQFVLDTSICAGSKLILHQKIFDENNPSDTVILPIANQFGCDSVIIIHLKFIPSSLAVLDTSVCQGHKLVLHDRTYDVNHVEDTILLLQKNQLGCDSILHVRLSFLPTSNFKLDTFTCEGSFVQIHNQVFDVNTNSGPIVLNSANQFGCDSILNVQLHFYPKSASILDTVTCPRQSVVIHGHTFHENHKSDRLLSPFPDMNGCDSTILVQLSILPEYFFMDTVRECGEFFWPVNGVLYDRGGRYFYQSNTMDGCDSTHTLFLEILPEYQFYDTICTIDRYTWSVNNTKYEHSGFYQASLRSKDLCDSIHYLVLEIISTGEIYIPNVFSPNGDGINDLVSVFSNPDVKMIQHFSIYDRWGERMYELNNFTPNIPHLGWDGSFQSELVKPGVFVYLVVWEDKLGGLHKQYGDVTLIR
ncbi:MAG: gliding motility-associated C-terminal domain-containing protein [Saprospiraceae bacterium]|nr:gliding motility-associated C-terminal domain-containing protein [Saprospiraceae bacterium]